MMADCYFGLAQDEYPGADERRGRACQAITQYGVHGYRTAATLVGPDEADRLLAEIQKLPPDEVTAVRAQKGF